MKCGRAPLNLNPTWLKARRSASWFSAPLKREGNLGAKSDCKTAALAGGPGYNRRMIRLRSPSGAYRTRQRSQPIQGLSAPA